MAIYEYFCPTCRLRFERRRSMSEAAATAACAHGHEANRVLSAFAVSRGGENPVFEDCSAFQAGACGGGACACAAAPAN